MARYHDIVHQIEKLIAEQHLRPGDPLPPERELAKRFGVAYGTIRTANDALIRRGLIERQQGRGTFVAAEPPSTKAARRLGLLSVDMGNYESPYLRALTFAMQRQAQDVGYELVVEPLDIEQLVQGQMPRMVRRKSVDGIFLYGRVRPHHVRFLQEQPLPVLLIGNRPVPHDVPQVRCNAQSLGYQVTREIFRLGRGPVWFDADAANTDYEAGQEMLRGYSKAVAEFGEPGAPLHLCSIRMHRLDEAVEQLVRADLTNAAYIVQDWAASLLIMRLALRDPQKLEQLLVVPMPSMDTGRQVYAPHVARWDGLTSVDDLASPAIRVMRDLLNGRSDKLASVQLEFDISLAAPDASGSPDPTLRCAVTEAPFDGSTYDAAASELSESWL